MEKQIRNYLKILDTSPDNVPAFEALVKIYQDHERWGELANLYTEKAQRTSQKQKTADLLFAAADIFAERLAKFDRVEECYLKVMEHDPLNDHALAALKKRFRDSHQWDKLIHLLEKEAANHEEPEDRANCLTEIAGLWEQELNNYLKKIDYLEKAQEAYPSHLSSLRQLKTHYLRTFQVDAAVKLVDREEALLENEEERGELYLEVGMLLSEDPFEKDRSIEYLDRAIGFLGRTKKAREAKDKLKELRSLDEKWEDFTRNYQEKAINVSDKREASMIYQKIAGIFFLYAPERDADIMSSIEKSLLLDSSNQRALLLGERYLMQKEEWGKLVDFYQDIYTRTRNENLKLDAMAKAAEIKHQRLGLAEEALDLYKQVIAFNPDHSAAFQFVREDLERKEDWDQLRNLLNNRLENCNELSAKVETLIQLARLATDQENDPGCAIGHLEQVQELSPGNLDSSLMLLDLYENGEHWDKLLDIFPIISELAPVEENGGYERRMADVLREKMGRNAEAYDHYVAAFTHDPDSEEILLALEELTIELECWEKLVGLFKQVLSAETPPKNAKKLKFRLGQIYDKELSHYAEAEACYQELIEEEVDLQTLDALSRLYMKDLRWDGLVDILRKKAEITSDLEERRDVLLEVAHIFQADMADPESATKAYYDVLDVMPDVLEALKQLQILHEGAGQFRELTEVIGRELEFIVSNSEKINLNFKLGTIYKEQLDDNDAAAMAFLNVLELDAGHLPAIETLEELLTAEVKVAEIFRGLEEYYRRLEKWDKLADGYEVLYRSEEDGVQKGALCHKLSEIYQNSRDLPETAFEWVKKGLKTPYHDSEFLSLALAVARKIDKQSELLELLETKAETTDEVEENVRLSLSLGTLYWEGMQDDEQAEKHYLNAADLAPENAEALEAVTGFFKQTENWEQFTSFGERLASATDDADQIKEVLFDVADAYENRLKDLEATRRVFALVLGIDAADRLALDELLRLQETDGLWEEAVETLLVILDLVSEDAERLQVKMKLAGIYESHLDQYDDAADLYSDVLANDPHHPDAFAAMENFLEKELCEQQVATTLRPIYEDRRNFEKLSRVLILQFQSSEGDDAYQLAIRIASLFEEEMSDSASAFEWYGNAFLLGGGVTLLKELMMSASEAGLYNGMVDLGDQKLEQELDEEERVELLINLAAIERQELADSDAAWLRYDTLLELKPDHDLALEALIELAREKGDWKSLVEYLDSKRRVADEKNVRRETALELADIRYRHLDEIEEALEILEELMAERENDPQVFDQMETILQEQNRWETLTELLERKLKYLREDEDILPVKIQVGSILENNLDRLDEAMQIYLELVGNYWNYPVVGALVERLLSQESTELKIANEMEHKYIKTQDWQHLVQVHEIQLRYTDDQTAKVNMLSKLSRIYQEKLQDPEKAFEGFARVFIDDPNNVTALKELEKLSGDLGAWKELAEVYDKAGEASVDMDEATQLFIKAARLYEEILAFQEDSIRVYRKVLDRDRNNMTAIQALEGLCRKTERWEELRDIYLQRIELTEDVAEKKELYSYICILYEHQLDDPMGTIPYYEAILELSPNDVEVVDKLLGLYEQSEDWFSKADILHHKLSLIDDVAIRNDLMLERASVMEEKLNDLVGAKDLFKSVMENDEDNEAALNKLEEYVEREEFQDDLAHFLEPIYFRWEEWNSLIDMQEYQFSHSEDADERLRLLKEIAATYEDRLNKSNLSYAVYTRAFRENAVDELVRERLLDLAGTLGQFEQLSDLYEEQLQELSSTDATDQMVTLLLDLARIFETHLQEIEASGERYRRVLELSENHPEALVNLERIYTLQKKWPELIETLDSKFKITESIDERKMILFEVANIHEEELKDNIQAIAVYRRILELDDSDGDALRSLVRLTTGEELWEDLIGVRRRQLEIAESEDESWRLKHEIGLILWRELERSEEAIDIFAAVLGENHHHEMCRESMEGLLKEDDNELAAAKILEPYYDEDGRWNDLIKTLSIQAEHSEIMDDRRDLFLRMAELAERNLSAPDRAFSFTVSALESDPQNGAIREQMERLAEETERWPDLAVAYRDLAGQVAELEIQVDLFLNAGRIALKKVNNLEEAESYFAAVRVRQADNLAALDALDEIFELTEQWPDLVDVYFTKAKLSDDLETKLALYTSSAKVREEKLEDPSAAVACYLEALNCDENHVPSLEQLDRLYQQLELWSELRDILSRHVALSEDIDQRLALTYRKGSIVEEHLEDSEAALAIYRTILQENDEYEDAIKAIENMVADEKLQAMSLEILTPLFTEKGWWERLTDILEVQLDSLLATQEKVGVLSQIKEIYEFQLADADRAFQVSCRIFEEDYRDQVARQEMERLAVVTGGFEGLINTYRSFFDQVGELDLKIEIMTKIGRTYEEQLQSDESAIESYRSVLELEKENFTAILALDRLYERMERYSDLVELIPQEFDLIDDPKEAMELRLRLAYLWEEKLEDNLTAIDVYRQVTDQNPDNPTALSALERLYEKESMWSELIEIFKAEVRIARGDTKKARLYDKMAQVLYEHLEKAREAIPLWNRVLQFDEQNDRVREKLENLYHREEMWDELVGHYKKRLRRARGASERSSITKQMAKVYHDQLKQEDQATQLFLKVIEYTPDDLEVIDILEKIYVSNESWRDLVDLLNRLAPQVSGDELRSIYLRQASINVERLDNQAEGEKLARRVLEMEPTAEELDRLDRVFQLTQKYDLYLEILEKQYQVTEEQSDLVALNFRMADIWSEKLGDMEKTRRNLEAVLEIVPGNLQAAEALEPIYREAGLWAELINVMNIRLAEETTEAERMQFHVQIADIYEHHLESYDDAFKALVEVYRLDITDEALLERVEALSEKVERHLDLAHLIRDVLPQAEGNAKLQRNLTLKVAGIYETKAVNNELAAEYYNIFLETGEYNEHAVDFLIDYYESIQGWSELVTVYQIKIPYMTQEEKIAIGCRVGAIFDVHMGETERSIKTYQQVLKMDEGCEEAIDALITIFERRDSWPELVEELRHKLHLVTDGEVISDIRLRIADVYQNRLNDLKQAKSFYRSIIVDNPKHHRALDELEKIYLAEENYDELLEVLSRRVNVTETDDGKIELYRKMADIWETKFEQRDMAVSYLEKILTIQANNMEAISALERIYRESNDWPSLVAAYQRHVDQTIEAEDIVQLYTEMGRIYGEYLFQPSKAIEFFGKALKIDEDNLDVMDAISELYITNERWEEAIETLERMASLSREKTDRVDALSRLGRIYLDNTGEPDKAKEVFDRMVEEDPTFVPALRALRQYFETTKEWSEFLRMVEEEKRYVEDPLEKAELLHAEGRYYHEEELDVDRALQLYREALELADNYLPVLTILGQIYFERQNWNDAKQVLSRLLELSAAIDDSSRARIHYQLAYICEQEENYSESLKHYTEAYKLNSNSLPTLEGLARMLQMRGDWERAFRVYQTILVRFRDQKSVPELVELFCRLGEVNRSLEKNDVAVRMYEKALELDPDSVRALSATVYFYESVENWNRALQFRGRLIKLQEGDELFEQWRAVGDIYSEKLENPEKGLEAYRFALELKANDVQLLTKVADLLLGSDNFDDAIGVLRSAVSIEKDPQCLFDLNLKLGELVREHGEDPELCLDYYNAALDAMPDREDIFKMMEGFLVEQENWEMLDTSYRLMIARIPPEDSERQYEMWKKLGMLLEDKSDSLEEAIQAWEVVAQFKPENISTQEHIADLYALSPDYRDKAVGMHRALLEHNPERTNSYESLWKIFYEAEEFDKAFCFGGPLAYMDVKDSKAAQFYKENLTEAKVTAINTLDRQLWGSLLLHPDARHNLGQILTIIFHHVPGLMPSDLKNEKLRKRDRLALEESINFCTSTTQILKTLGLPAPAIYLKKDFGPGIEPIAVQPAALAIGTDAFENFPQRKLIFLIAKNMILARPDFLMGLMLPASEVIALLEASALMFDSKFKIRGDKKYTKGLQKKLEKAIPRKVREPLSGFVLEFCKMADDFDIENWRKALRFSANRGGLLLCNDLSTAAEILREFPGGLSPEQVEEVIADLIQFSTSESNFHLRNFLGLSIV